MPFKRRRRFSRRRRKRRRRRSRGRSAFGFRVNKAVSRQIHGLRKFMQEDRNEGIENSKNRVMWKALCEIGSRAHVEDMLTQTGGLRTTLGTVEGVGDYTVGNDRLFTLKYDISNYKMTNHFRNVGEHEGILTIYEVCAKQSFGMPAGIVTIPGDVMTKLDVGWNQQTVAGASSNTQVTGEALQETRSGGEMQVYSQFLAPYNSPEFRKYYSIKKVKKYKLNAGDEVYWTTRCRNRVWNPTRIYQNNLGDGVETIDVIKNYTKCLLIKWHGCMGRSVATGEEDVIGLMSGDLTIDCLTKASLAPLAQEESDHYKEVNIDDLVTGPKTLGAGTQHAILDDQN